MSQKKWIIAAAAVATIATAPRVSVAATPDQTLMQDYLTSPSKAHRYAFCASYLMFQGIMRLQIGDVDASEVAAFKVTTKSHADALLIAAKQSSLYQEKLPDQEVIDAIDAGHHQADADRNRPDHGASLAAMCRMMAESDPEVQLTTARIYKALTTPEPRQP